MSERVVCCVKECLCVSGGLYLYPPVAWAPCLGRGCWLSAFAICEAHVDCSVSLCVIVTV